MNDEQPDEIQPRHEWVAAPPTTAVPLQREQRSIWPMVIGIIAIVFGVMAMLNGCMGAVGMFFMDAFVGFMPDDEELAQLEAMRSWLWFVIASSVIGMVLGGMLIACAIGVLMRRQWGVRTCVAWAAMKIIYELAIIVPSIRMQSAQMGAMAEDDPSMAGMERFFEWMALGSVLLGTLFGMAMPIFLLIWFARPAIKTETAAWA